MSENQQNDNVQPCKWPYKKHEDFENELRKAAADWFRERGYKTQKEKDTFSLKMNTKMKMNYGTRISSVKMSSITSRRKNAVYTHIYITD